MNVKEVDLTFFTSHDRTVLKLEDRGLYCIVGENGAGKSSIVEGVSWCGWGKTLRGTAPWRRDTKLEPCTARLLTDVLEITRSRAATKSVLVWNHVSEDQSAVDSLLRLGAHGSSDEYDTPTKAAEALASMLGPFDLWRRSHVFSTADAHHFTIATDKERKQLIESFLGLNRFDPALQRCREDLKQKTAEVADLKRKQEVGAAKLEAARTRLTEAKQALAAVKPPPEPQAPPGGPVSGVVPAGEGAAQNARSGAPGAGKTVPELDVQLAEARREVTAARDALRKADRAGDEHEHAARSALALLDRLRDANCPTCTQPITDALRKRLRKEADDAKAAATSARETAGAQADEAETLIEELEEEISALQKKRDERAAADAAARAKEQAEKATRAAQEAIVRRAREEQERYKTQRALLERQLREADNAISALTEELVDVEEKLDEANVDFDELTAVEHVLGLKGVRAHILGKSLAGIESVSNAWLAKLHPGLRVALRPYSELKKGGYDDSISIEVTGAGHDLGYKASSRGERQRLDIAILLAMAEVSAAARGVQAGTLFFDEVLDGLDEAGVEAVASALQEMAQDRAVVVITHSSALLGRLPGARKIRVTKGMLEEI